MDNVSEVDLGGASNCNLGHTNCFSYVYDGEGNLDSSTDSNDHTRSYGYDDQNRLVSETVPGQSSPIALGYDGDGNLLTYSFNGDTISYGYNAADQVDSYKENSGSTYTISDDKDGRPTAIPLADGVTLHDTYHADGSMQTSSTTGGSGLLATTTYLCVPNTSSALLEPGSAGWAAKFWEGFGSCACAFCSFHRPAVRVASTVSS